MNTTAQQISAFFDDDGSLWEVTDGTERTLDDIIAEHGGVFETADKADLEAHPELVPWRAVFPDGSAICWSDAGWDIEGSRPFLMAGLE